MKKDSGSSKKGGTTNDTNPQASKPATKLPINKKIETIPDRTQRLSPRLITKLKSLFPTTSKETLQTHSKWILFHSTRHERSICATLLHYLLQSCYIENNGGGNNSATTVLQKVEQLQEKKKGLVYLSILHEMLIMYNNKVKEWTRHSKFRSRLGDSVLRPFLERVVVADHTGTGSHGITADVRDSLETMVRVWTNLDCFSGGEGNDSATLIDDISRLILRIDTVSTNSSTIGSADISSSPKRNSHEPKVEDAGTDTEGGDFMDVDTPERTRDDASAANKSPNKRQVRTPSSSPEKRKKSTIEQQQSDDRLGNSNSDDASMSMPLTPTATDDDMFGMCDDEEAEGQEKSQQKLMSEVETGGKADIKTATTTPASLQEKEFDFESEGIPHQKVEINQLQAPCKSIATVQITRDLHSDTAHSVSALLSTVPDTVLKACQDAIKQSTPTKGKENDNNNKRAALIDLKSLPTIPDPVLDLNLKQILSNVRSHRDIIQKQMVARKTLVDLLVQSRCQFGSRETAEIYYGLRETIDRLQSCKSKVLDAMELEGLDREGIDGNADSHGGSKESGGEDALKDFEWFTRDQAEGDNSSKRVKLV